MNDHLSIVGEMQTWLEKSVIGLNLCPFAKAVHLKKQIRYHVSSASTGEELLRDLISELKLLENTNPVEIDTVLLIHPDVLSDFLDYNDFLEIADAALLELGWHGIFQIASFHPQYQFAGSSVDDISNYTNRSPYPALHILREASVTKAVDSYLDVEGIPERNIQTLKALGLDGWNRLGVGRC